MHGENLWSSAPQPKDDDDDDDDVWMEVSQLHRY